MGEFDLDRESFVVTKKQEPPPRRRFPIAGPLIVLVLVMLVGFAAYKLMQGNGTVSKILESSGVAALANNNSDVPQIMQRLDEIEQRLDQIEKRRKTEPSTAAGKSASREMKPHPDEAAVADAPSQPEPQAIASAQPKSSPDGGSAAQKEAGSRPDASSSQEQWQAAADRLGNVVGELASQRDEIERNRASLGQLSERVGQKSTQPFTLKKGDRTQRVGPVWLALESTDPRNQRYTLNLLVDNKPVELKDRALHETIQFTPASGGVPFELVVSEIRKDGVTGRLALPRSN